MKSTERFSDRVENYALHRPHYPAEMIAFLEDISWLTDNTTAADIGSGTGISAAPFLEKGHTIYGVEPNFPMREKAMQLLGRYSNFHSINGTAENTSLPDASVDLVICAQAFHWFDPDKAKAEFKRIATGQGRTVLIWNERNIRSPFEEAYEQLILKYATDYTTVNHKNISPEKIRSFFSPAPVYMQTFQNEQQLDFEGLKGRWLSSSYVPNEGNPRYTEAISELKKLFDAFQSASKVCITYETRLYFGALKRETTRS